MKKYTLLLIFTFSISFLSAQNKEEEAIKKVIIDESTAWANRDTTAYFAAYANNELTQGVFNNRNLSIGTYNGFAAIQKSVRDGMKANPNQVYKPTIERTNWLVKVLSPEWAWVNFTQKTTTVRGIINTSYETRLMKKERDNWRINVVNAMWDYKNVEYPTPNPDEEDIKKVILAETTAFQAGNIDAFMDMYADVPYLIWTVTNGGEPGDVLTYRGYKALKEWAMNLPWFKNYKPDSPPNPNASVWEKDNWNIEIKGNIAIVNFDEHWIYGKEKSKLNVTVVKILERINGKWKFINTSALGDFKDAVPPIRTKY